MNKKYERSRFKALSRPLNKKKLYKKGKNWVIGNLTLLAITGMGVAVAHTTHADTHTEPTVASVGSTADIEKKATALYNHVVAQNIVSNNASHNQKQQREIKLGADAGDNSSNPLDYYQHNGYMDSSSSDIKAKNQSMINYALSKHDQNPVDQDTIYGPDRYTTNTPKGQKVYQTINTPGFQQYIENDAKNRFNQIKAANDDKSFTEYFIASDFPRLGNDSMPNGLGDASNAIAITSDTSFGNGNSGVISKEVNDYRNAYNKAHGLPTSDTSYKFDYTMGTHGAQVGYAYQWGINKVYISVPPRLTVNYTYNGKVISTPFDQRFMYRNWYYHPQSAEGTDNFSNDNVLDFYNINEDGNNRTREFANYNEAPNNIDENKDYWDINHFNSDKIYYSDWKDVPAIPRDILQSLPNGYQYTFKLTHSDLASYGAQVQKISDYQNSYAYPDAPQYDKSFVINIPLTLNAVDTSFKPYNTVTFVDKNTNKPIGQWVSKTRGHRNEFDNDMYQFYLNISNPANYSKANIVLPDGYALSGSDALKFQQYIYPPTGYVNGRFNYGANYTIPLSKPVGNTITYMFNGRPIGQWNSPTTGVAGTRNNDLLNIYNTIQSDSAPGMPSGYYIKDSDFNNFLNTIWPPNGNDPSNAVYGRNFKINVTNWSNIHVYFEDADTGANLMSGSQPEYDNFQSYVNSPFSLSSAIPNYKNLFNNQKYHYVGMLHSADSFDENPGEIHTIDLLYAPNTTTKDYAPVENTVNYKLSGADTTLSSASHDMTEYSRAAVSSATSMSYGSWTTQSSLASVSYPSEIISNHNYYHEVSANVSLPSDAQINKDLNSNSSQGARYTTDVFYAPDSIMSKPENASATTATYYYWDNGNNSVSSASTVNTYDYNRTASYDTNLNSYIGSFGNWSITSSSTDMAKNVSSDGDSLVASYGSLPDSTTIMNGLIPGRTTSYANYVIYAADSVCDTHDYASATDTVQYLVSGTNSALSAASSSTLLYSRADVKDHTTNSASVSDWQTQSNFNDINVPHTIMSNGITYSEVNANTQVPNVAQDSLTANTANYENDIYYAPVVTRLTVDYVNTTNGNVVKATDAGTMDNGKQWNVNHSYLDQVPADYVLDNNYNNNANTRLLRNPITVTANGGATATVYVKPASTPQHPGPITVHYVTSDSQPVQNNGKNISDITFTGQPLTATALEKQVSDYVPVSIMGNLSYTDYPQNVYVVYKPIQKTTRGHIHVRYVDDSNQQHEFWSDKFSDQTGNPFDLNRDHYADRYIPGYRFDNHLSNNVHIYGSDSASNPHIITVGYSKIPNDPIIDVPQSASATEEINYLADDNGKLSQLTAPINQSVEFRGNATVNTQTHQFSSATSWSTDQNFSSASAYNSAGWSLFSSANDIPASIAPGGHYIENLYYKPVQSSASIKPSPSSANRTPKPASSSTASSSAKIQPSIPVIPNVPSMAPVSPASSAKPIHWNSRSIAYSSSSNAIPKHKKIRQKVNTTAIKYNSIHHRRQQINHKSEQKRHVNLQRTRQYTAYRSINHIYAYNMAHGLRLRFNYRKRLNHSGQQKNKLPQTNEPNSYSALYAILFIISSIILTDLSKAIDKQRNQ